MHILVPEVGSLVAVADCDSTVFEQGFIFVRMDACTSAGEILILFHLLVMLEYLDSFCFACCVKGAWGSGVVLKSADVGFVALRGFTFFMLF
jgi:hypothetical protein